MARVRSTELVIEGYKAKVSQREVTVSATGRSYDQRDDRAYELVLTIPAEDAVRVAGLFRDAAEAAREMSS